MSNVADNLFNSLIKKETKAYDVTVISIQIEKKNPQNILPSGMFYFIVMMSK